MDYEHINLSPAKRCQRCVRFLVFCGLVVVLGYTGLRSGAPETKVDVVAASGAVKAGAAVAPVKIAGTDALRIR